MHEFLWTENDALVEATEVGERLRSERSGGTVKLEFNSFDLEFDSDRGIVTVTDVDTGLGSVTLSISDFLREVREYLATDPPNA